MQRHLRNGGIVQVPALSCRIPMYPNIPVPVRPNTGKIGTATWPMAAILLLCIYTYQQAR